MESPHAAREIYFYRRFSAFAAFSNIFHFFLENDLAFLFDIFLSNEKEYVVYLAHHGRNLTNFLSAQNPSKRRIGRSSPIAWSLRSPNLIILNFVVWRLLRTLTCWMEMSNKMVVSSSCSEKKGNIFLTSSFWYCYLLWCRYFVKILFA